MTRLKKPDHKMLLWLFCISILGFVPWLYLQMQNAIHGDMAWLLIAAGRLLDGRDMASAYYDPNPPLSVILHVPPVFISRLLGAPVEHVANAMILLFIIGCGALSALVMRRLSHLDALDRYTLLLAFGAGATIIASVSFGERDHLIGVALFPFILTQLALSWGERIPRPLQLIIFALGTFMILVKPHFGIVPTVLLLHRLWIRKDLSLLKDLDFLILAAGTLTYTGSIFAFFPDYVDVIFPDVLALYLDNKDPVIAMPMLLSAGIMSAMVLGMELAFSEYKGRQKGFMAALYLIALLCLIPFAVQMKGYYYQILPAYIFFLIAFSYSMLHYLHQYVKSLPIKAPLAITITFALAYSFRPLVMGYPTHQGYNTLPMARAITDNCNKDQCSVLIFHNNIEIAPQTFLYSGTQWASRFSSFWMVPEIHNGLQQNAAAVITREQAEALQQKYTGFVKQDLTRYQPDLIILMRNFYFADQTRFDFVSFFDLSREMRAYEKVDELVMDQGAYFAGTNLGSAITLEYDIYAHR